MNRLNTFENLFAATRVVDSVKAQEAMNTLFNAITGSSSINQGYKLIAFYQTLNMSITCYVDDAKEISVLKKIKAAVKAQIDLIDDYNEIGLFSGLFQVRAKKFHEAKKLHCPIELHPDVVDAMY
ncbi:MAG: hypothetical protein NTY80_03675 [candidate division SR1 bacterium]|nr:hypothetical protein [candidate division SR1 bacterium]